MKNLDLRQTYIIMYKKDDIRYIFNRSVDFQDYLGKDLQNILRVIGVDIIASKIDEFIDCHRNICENISNIESYLDENNCVILDKLPELPNINLSNQKEINSIKKKWCDLLDAVDRQDKINISDEKIFSIPSLKCKLWDYVDNIYNEIMKSRRYKNDVYYERIDDVDNMVEDYKNKKRDYLKNVVIEKTKRMAYILENKPLDDTTKLRNKIMSNKELFPESIINLNLFN